MWSKSFFVACMACLIGSSVAQAQEYPSRPIKFIIPSATGGLTDTMGRLLGQRLSERVGQPVLVENRTGAGSIVGMKAGAQAAPDGYTITLTFLGAASVNPILYAEPPYDTSRDFVGVSLVASFPMVLLTDVNLSVKSVKEFVDLARSKPGGLNYGSPGNAATAHLAMELFKRRTGIDVVHIPFKGEAAPLHELMAGRLSVLFMTLGSALPAIQAGKVRALAIATRERSKRAPEIPTLAEAGVSDVEVPGWYGVLAPANTPKPIVDRLNREIVAIMNDGDFRTRLAGLGVDPASSTPEAFGAYIRDETERWRKVVKDAGIKAD